MCIEARRIRVSSCTSRFFYVNFDLKKVAFVFPSRTAVAFMECTRQYFLYDYFSIAIKRFLKLKIILLKLIYLRSISEKWNLFDWMTFVTEVRGSLSRTKILLFTARKSDNESLADVARLIRFICYSPAFSKERISGYGNSSSPPVLQVW